MPVFRVNMESDSREGVASNRRPGIVRNYRRVLRSKARSPVVLRRVELHSEADRSSSIAMLSRSRPMTPKLELDGGGYHQMNGGNTTNNTITTTNGNGFNANKVPLPVRFSIDLETHDVSRLERLYGGKAQAHQAACIIQSAYRAHRIRRDYQQIRLQKLKSQQPLSETILSSPIALKPVPSIFRSEPPPEIIGPADTKSEVSTPPSVIITTAPAQSIVSPVVRDRMRRVMITLFNQSPRRGLDNLIREGFIDDTSEAITTFLMEEKSLSRIAVGEYLGLLEDERATKIFKNFLQKITFTDKPVDVALRFFLSHFHIPGESQKILYMMQEFQEEYCRQNADFVKETFRDRDTITVLCYAIIMLHTDFHNPNVNKNRNRSRMTKEQFVANLRGVDRGEHIPRELLEDIYRRTVTEEFKVTPDPTNMVRKVAQCLQGPQAPANLADRHRRLVSLTHLCEVKESSGFSLRLLYKERTAFLFNDSLLLTKSQLNRGDSPSFIFKNFIPLLDVHVTRVNGATPTPINDPRAPSNVWIELKRVSDERLLCRLTYKSRDLESAELGSQTELEELLHFHRQLYESILEVREVEKMRVHEHYADCEHFMTIRHGLTSWT